MTGFLAKLTSRVLTGLAAFCVLAALPLSAGTSMAWTSISFGDSVTMQIPPGAHHLPGKGIDSIIGTIAGDGFTCDYDLGVYANRLSGIESSTEQAFTLSGRPARLISATGFLGLHVGDIEKTLLGPKMLSFSCVGLQDSVRTMVEKMLRSVKLN